jgi:phage terminase large subunit
MSTKQIGRSNKKYAVDDLIICDSAEPRLITELSEYCNIKPTIKRIGSILSGIALLQDFDIIVDVHSVNIVKELNNYVWHQRNQKPIDNWNHFLDAIRYGLDYFMKTANKGKYVIR